MGSQILFYASPEDQLDLLDYIRSLGLFLVAPDADLTYTDDATILCGCFVSPVPADQLQLTAPRNFPKIRYSDAVDPIIALTRCIYQPPYLVTGDIYWNNDNEKLAKLTLSTFRKIASWIRKNWPKPEGNDCYYSPGARRLVFEEGMIATSIPPGVAIHYIPIDKPIVGTKTEI